MSLGAIDSLYHAFRKVRQPLKIEGCTQCCTNNAELSDLEKGARGASTRAVQKLAHKGMTTIGSAADYKYFLPRILHEMILNDGFWYFCLDALTTRIQRSGFEEWSEMEKSATLLGFKAIFEKFCAEYDCLDLEGWLYGIACVDFDVTRF
jgi:hypothetical protein